MKNLEIRKNVKNRLKDIKFDRVLTVHNYINAAQRARKWIDRNTIQGNGIVITSKQRKIYQEVTGYYIPTLLQWGMRDRAIAYAEYLCDIQEESGAWLDGGQKRPSIFNTGQVLRGLVSIVDAYPNVRHHLIKGCDWLISNIDGEGRLVATEGTQWSDGFNSELIHLYCLPPLLEAGKRFQREDYILSVEKCKKYYLDHYRTDIDHFHYLSHFYAYVLEALLDLGELDIVRTAMNKIKMIQKPDGAIPAFKDCNWVCSTGLFQFAIVWFKLGEYELGNKAFDYAVSLQNKSGGWYGGYKAYFRLSNGRKIPFASQEEISYFPDQEISWAVKYFFDALYWRELNEFNRKASSFILHIESDDGKYQAVNMEMEKLMKNGKPLKVLDIGCGKGRYLKKMFYSYPENEYYGIDLSGDVLKYVRNPNICVSEGSILNSGQQSETFDLVLAAESIEHAVFIDLAIAEMCRITKEGGSIVIIDKDRDTFEALKYREWILPEELSTKQWLDTESIYSIFTKNNINDIEIFDISSNEGKMYKAYIGRKGK